MKTVKSPFKEHPLHHVISAIRALNIQLSRSRNEFLAYESEKAHFEATLVKNSFGTSNAEKTVNARATPEWMNFHRKLARLESEYEFLKFEMEILEKEYQAQYLALKQDNGLIEKGLDG
jgi:hypothetical protein